MGKFIDQKLNEFGNGEKLLPNNHISFRISSSTTSEWESLGPPNLDNLQFLSVIMKKKSMTIIEEMKNNE